MGGSAASMVALRGIVKRLPQDFRAVLFVVQHSLPDGSAAASPAQLVQPHAAMSVHVAADRPTIPGGTELYRRPNHHLTLEGRLMRIEKSPVENHNRPSIDVLFRPPVVGRRFGAAISRTALLDCNRSRSGRSVIGTPALRVVERGRSGIWARKNSRRHPTAFYAASTAAV